MFHYRMPTAVQCFVLGVSSPYMLQEAARLAHGKPLFMDATFGMNDHKVLSAASCCSASTKLCCLRARVPMIRFCRNASEGCCASCSTRFS